jgi:hypothetical protein
MMDAMALGGAGGGAASSVRKVAETERNSRSTSPGPIGAPSPLAGSVRTGRFPKLRYFKPGVFMAAATRATSGSWPI